MKKKNVPGNQRNVEVSMCLVDRKENCNASPPLPPPPPPPPPPEILANIFETKPLVVVYRYLVQVIL